MTTPSVYHLGVLGYPLGHSLSGIFQPVYLEQIGLAGDYTRQEVSPENLDAWVQAEKARRQLNGFNVTIPHKVRILPYLDSLSGEARLIGAVNTVYVTDTGWHGYNTDAFGFMSPLKPGQRSTLKDAQVLVIGAGGASRAVAYGLLSECPRQLTFWVRSLERSAETRQAVSHMAEVLTSGKTEVVWIEMLPQEELAGMSWVINTSPVGMYPHAEGSPLDETQISALPAGALVYDLVYNPLETRLLGMARECGLLVQDGLDMLLYQGARSLSLWTGVTVPEQAVEDARETVLSGMEVGP